MAKRIVYKLSGLVTIVIFIVVSLSFTSIERKHMLFSNIQIVFKEPYQFVTTAEIETIVNKNFKGLNGALIDTINTEVIENKIEENPWVKNAEVFKGYASSDSFNVTGGIKIYIEQEVPVLRVVDGASGYYVNSKGKHLPFSGSYTTKVTVYTGKIGDDELINDLLSFEKAITADPFLSALVQQVDVQSDHELILVPRVGDHVIEFGKIENIEKKFRNLKAVYQNGFDEEAWYRYKKVSLKYKNQVICTLK